MLAPEDLIDLGAALRRTGIEIDVATQQFLAAQHFLLRLAAEGALPSARAGLESYLAPIFCSSALDQSRFGPAYRAWLRERFPEELVPAEPAPPVLPPPPPPQWRWVKPAIAAFVAAALLGIWFSLQHWRPREVQGAVREEGEPAAGVQVSIGDRSVRTGADGNYRLRFRAADLPAPVVAQRGTESTSKPFADDLYAARQTLYLGAPFGAATERADIDLPRSKAADVPKGFTKPVAAVATKIVPERVDLFDAADWFEQPKFLERVRWRNAALIALPLVAFFGWYAWQLLRRPVLQRRASRTPPQLSDVHLPGGARAVVPGYPLRRLAQELRRRRTIESNELQVEPTIAATLRRAGMFTAVRGSRAEPDYFALVDRATLSDHQARLAAEVVADLARSDVLIERYDFDRDATVCRPRDTHALPKLHPTPAPGRTVQPRAVELADLRERFPDHRMLAFTDGAGCFDGFTGASAPWLGTLLAWPFVALITPVPVERWGKREQALAALGVHVLPLGSDGLGRLIEIVSGGAREPAVKPGRAAGLHDRMPRRWLERQPPAESVVRELCADLRADLGERGFAWIAACGGYPEIHWGITLRLGMELVPDCAELERLLPRIARLPWFREAYMPDWLRAALLDQLEPDDEARVRKTLYKLLQAFAPGAAADEVPLRIASGEPVAAPSRWRRWAFALQRWSRRQTVPGLVRQADDDSPLRDYVFLRFLRGESLGRLDLAAPGALANLIRTSRRALLAPAAVALVGVAIASGIVSTFFPAYDTLEYAVWSRGMKFSPDGRRVGFVSSLSADPQDGALRTIAQRVTVAPVGPSREGTVSNDHSGSDAVIAPNLTRVAVIKPGRLEVSAPDMSDDKPEVLDSPGHVEFLAFSADGTQLAAAYRDGTVRLWNYNRRSTTGAGNPPGAPPVTMLEGHTDAVTMLVFSPDGAMLATGSRDRTVRTWDTATGAQRNDYAVEGPVNRWGLAFDRSGGRLAAASGTEIELWEVGSGRNIRREDAGGTVNDLAFSVDGRNLAVATDTQALVIPLDSFDANPLDNSSPAKLDGQTAPVQWVSYSPDGRFLATIDRAGTTRLWDAQSGTLAADPLALEATDTGGHEPDLLFSDDGRTLAVSNGGRVALWQLPVAATPGPASASYALMIANDYPGSSNAQRSPVRDARNVGGALRDRFGFGVQPLENQPRAAVIAALDRLAATVRPEDRVVVYLSGSGTEQPATRYAFVANAPPGRTDLDMKADLISGDELLALLRRMPAREILLLVDTSAAYLLGATRAAGGAASASGAQPLARVLITSASRGQLPMDSTRAQGSAFGVAVADALRSAGPGFTARALFDGIAKRMAADKEAVKQRPSYARLLAAGDTNGSFTFPDPIGGGATSAAQAVPQPAPAGVQRGPVVPLRPSAAQQQPAPFVKQQQAAECGGIDQRPCTVIERIPSCDRGLVVSAGTCIEPVSQAPPVQQQAPPMQQQALPVQQQQAPFVKPQKPVDCGGIDQRPCRVTEWVPSCDHGLVENGRTGTCIKPVPQAPPVQQQALPVQQQAPSVQQQAPSTQQQAPLEGQQAPSVRQPAPSVRQQAPPTQQAPSLEQRAPNQRPPASAN